MPAIGASGLNMELQGLLVLCGLGVAGVAVLLLMGLFSTSGTSYEEAIAQQRRATTELLALAENKGKSKKSTKKASKKQAKKEKRESVAVASASEPESEAPAESGVDEDVVPSKPHVEFKPPVVVDISRDTPPNVKIRKRGKDQKVKPILLNKDDPSCVSDRITPPSPSGSHLSNHFEDIHPKDDLELLHSSMAAEKAAEKKEEVVEKKDVKVSKQAKGKQASKAAPAAVEIKEEPVVVKEPSVDVPKEQRKAKKSERKSQSDETDAPREEVVVPLNAPQPSELTTDKLLKQIPVPAAPAAPVVAKNVSPANLAPSTKNKKKKQEPNLLALIGAESGGVNVNELVRLVKEASLSRNEIQTLTDVLLNKQHDPLPQHSEWTEGPNDPMQKLKKQLADKEKALSDEIEASQALHAKLKELRGALNAERSRGTAAVRAAEEVAAEVHTLQVRLQRALDEAHHAAQEKHLLQSKLSAEAEVQAQRVQMEMHIQRLTEAEGTLMAQLSVLQAEVGARAHEAGQARCDAAAARDAALLAQQHAAELAQQLQEANRVCAELDAQRQNAIHAEQAAQQEMRQLQERLSALSELQGEIQRATARAQTAEANVDKIKEDAEKQKQQLQSELSSLKEQLASREIELAEVKQLRATSAAPAQNGLPPSEEHKSAELSKVESVLASLREELAAAQRGSLEHKEQVASLRDQLKQYQDKNNELRTKNWKVMEALQSTEKALQSQPALPAQESLREAITKAEAAQYAEVASVLRAAWPAAAPSGSPSRAWLDAFAARVLDERARLEQAKPAQTAQSVQSPPDELKAQNEYLQGLVDKYKKIIEDTEGVLSRLQQNVTAEEARWAQQLTEKQRELDELRQKTVTQMQKKIADLEVELRQAKQNHSFADVERQTEERLLAKLTKLDSANGPLQVGIEEK